MQSRRRRIRMAPARSAAAWLDRLLLRAAPGRAGDRSVLDDPDLRVVEAEALRVERERAEQAVVLRLVHRVREHSAVLPVAVECLQRLGDERHPVVRLRAVQLGYF